MPTLIQNVGILDARKASPEQITEIGKISNIGVLLVNSHIKDQLIKVSMQNVGSTLDISEDYKYHVGPMVINRALLENNPAGLKMIVIGQVSVEPDIPVELLEANLGGLYLVGQAAVPEELYGVFMSKMKELTGMVDVVKTLGTAVTGKLVVDNEYLASEEDNTEISVVGKLNIAENVDTELFSTKISSISVTGVVACLDSQEAMVRKILKDTGKTQFRITRSDCYTVPSSTLLDTFTLMSIEKPLIFSKGIVILDSEVTQELLEEKNIRFEAKVVYFPKNLMQTMVSRLEKSTKGMVCDPAKMELITGEQQLTKIRLSHMPENTIMIVTGELIVNSDVSPDELAQKIQCLDNFGEITGSPDVASILQGKLRLNEGSIESEGSADDDEAYDNIIENVASYVL